MMNARMAGALTASLVAVALAGCATTPHGGLSRLADRLDLSAQAFAQDAPRGYDESRGYTQDAQDFADWAHEFRRAVEERGSDGRGARRELRPVTRAYLDVEDDMGGARAAHRYSDEDYDRGPG